MTDAENGRAETRMGNIQPSCFQDDTAAEVLRNQSEVEVYQDRKRLQLHPDISQCLRINKQTKNPYRQEVLLLELSND